MVTVVLSTAVAGPAGNLAPLAIGMTLTLNMMGGPYRRYFQPRTCAGPDDRDGESRRLGTSKYVLGVETRSARRLFTRMTQSFERRSPMLFMTMIVLAITVALTGGLAADALGGGGIHAGSAAVAIWVAGVVGLCAQSTTLLGSLAPQMPVFENRSPAPLAGAPRQCTRPVLESSCIRRASGGTTGGWVSVTLGRRTCTEVRHKRR